MKHRILIFIAGIVLLIFFAGFSRLVKQDRFTSVDFATTVKVQDRMPVIERFGGDYLWEDIGFLVSPPLSIVLVLLLTFIGLFKNGIRKPAWGALVIPLGFACMIGVELYGKSVVHHPAPPFFMLKNPTTIFPTYYVQEDFSYPSGHAARAIFLGVVGLTLIPKPKKIWVGIVFGVGIFLICVGKIYLGHHWISDIIGGALIGGSLGLLTGAVSLPYNTKAMSD